MPVVTFRLAPTIHKRFFEVCEERETTVSAVLQKAVEGFIDRVDEVKLETRPVRLESGADAVKWTATAKGKEPRFIGVSAVTGEPIYSRPAYQKKGK